MLIDPSFSNHYELLEAISACVQTSHDLGHNPKPLQLSHKITLWLVHLSMGSYCRNRDQEVAKSMGMGLPYYPILQNIISHIYIIVAMYMCPKNPEP